MSDDFLGGEENGLVEDSGLIRTDGFGKNVFQKNIDIVMHESMMPYSEHVILDRALPRVEDGLKPSQRRILYTMMELGVTPDKPHRKSARIVGDCLGKYHPHGDSSVYDAMVRMAQPFNMRACLVDGHGNFGTIDGDSAAAMRYTEVRLTPLALELLKDIDKDTVPFELNFDDTLKEPTILPARFPNLLVNGANGIAVGLATNIPPHNLGEVIAGICAYIDNPDISLENLMKFIPAPDFPTGGFLIGKDELINAYKTGRGKIKLRAKVHFEDLNGRKTIVITELPYQVNKARLLQKILELSETKKELQDIADIADESDRAGMRATIKLKKDADPSKILDALFRFSDLEVTYGINMVAIADGRPQQMGLLDIVAYYVDYQRQVIVRRTKFDLDAARERAHILEGLVIAVANIDEVIKIIKKSANTSEAKTNLKEKFVLSDRQAQAILLLRLAGLTSLEIEKLKLELEEVKNLIQRLSAILASRKLQFETIKTELGDIKRKFADERKVEILNDESEYSTAQQGPSAIVEKAIVVLTRNGCLKRLSPRAFSASRREILPRSSSADALISVVQTQTDKTLIAFTELGNAVKVNVADIPECRLSAKGVSSQDLAITDIVEPFVALFQIPDDLNNAGELLFFAQSGLIKRSAWTEYALIKNYYQAVKLKENDKLMSVEPFYPNGELVFVTKQGIILRADKSDIPQQGRVSSGVKGVALAEDDQIVFAGQAFDSDFIVVLHQNAFAKKVALADIDVLARYRKGVKISETKDPFGMIVFAAIYAGSDFDILCRNEDGEVIGHNTSEFLLASRIAKPGILTNKSKLISAIKF